MAMNTPYLGSSASAAGAGSGVSNLNTSYISTGLTEITSALSVWGPVTFLSSIAPTFASGVSASTGTFSSNVTIGGTLTITGATTGGAATFSSISVGTGLSTFSNTSTRGLADFQSTRTQSGMLSYHTTASATSLILPDGAMGFYFESATSVRLAFRSGVTTYTWIATTGAVL